MTATIDYSKYKRIGIWLYNNGAPSADSCVWDASELPTEAFLECQGFQTYDYLNGTQLSATAKHPSSTTISFSTSPTWIFGRVVGFKY